MTWVRIEDTFPEHPAIAGLSDGAYRLYVNSLCYSGRNLTDGFVPTAVAPLLYPKATAKRAAELVACGRWEVVEGGWQIHNYLERQRSRASVEAEREKAARRQKEWRDKQRDEQESNGVTSAEVRELDPESHPPENPSTQSVSPCQVGAPSQDGPDDERFASAVQVIAQKAIEANYKPGDIKNRKRLLDSVLAEKRTTHGPDAARLLAEYPDITASQLADVLAGSRTILSYLTRAEAS